MKNYSFLLVIALLVVCALAGNSDASYKSFSSNPAIQNLTLPVPTASGGSGMDTDSGMATATVDNSVPLQAAINNRIAKMTSTGSSFGIAPIIIPAGKYLFTHGVVGRPWIKTMIYGSSIFDFTGISSTGTAWQSYNDDAPAADWTNYYNASNFGPFINGGTGGVAFVGPGNSTSTTGLDLGNLVHQTNSVSMRHASVAGVSFSRFGTCLNLRPTDLYMLDFSYGGEILNCTTGININGTYSNSGEKLNFAGWVIGGNATLMTDVYYNTPDIGIVFDNVSFDFQNYVLDIGTLAHSGHITITNSHIENTESQIIKSELTSGFTRFLKIDMKNNVIVPTSLVSSNNRPNRPLITGYFTLNGDENYIGGWAHTSNDATHGMFLIDSNVAVQNFSGVLIAGQKQLIAQQTLLNSDPFFGQGTSGNDIVSSPLPTWTVPSGGCSGITGAVSTNNPLSAYGGTKSIEFTGVSNPSGNFCVLESMQFRVKPGQQLIADAAAYGNASTGTDKLQLTFYFCSTDASLPCVKGAAGDVGDNLSSTFGDSTDPAYTGDRLWSAKLKGVLVDTVPSGYNLGTVRLTMSQMAVSDVVDVNFAGVNSL